MSETSLTGGAESLDDREAQLDPDGQIFDYTGKAQRHIAAEAARDAAAAGARKQAVVADVQLDRLKDELRAQALAGDLSAQERLNRLYGNDPESIAKRADARQLAEEIAIARGPEPGPKPTITVNKFADGTEIDQAQTLRLVDTLRHVGARNDKQASEIINGWIARADLYDAEPARRPRAEATMEALSQKWGPNLDANLRLVHERFNQLFPDPKTNERLRRAFGSDLEFHEQLFDLVMHEYEHGTAITIENDPDEGDASPEAYERRKARADANLARLGKANYTLFEIPDR